MMLIGEKPMENGAGEQIEPSEPIATVPDYRQLFSTIEVDHDGQLIRIGNEQFRVTGEPIMGTKKIIYRLADYPDQVLKVVRADTHNDHNVFKSMYQIVERQPVLDQYQVPHLKILSADPNGPPYRYLIQEAAPAEAVSAAELIKSGQLSEEDSRQMADIVNRFEQGKVWQLDTNPFSWFRIPTPDGQTKMTYASGKVYRYDEQWEFRRVGLLQWLQPEYVASGENYAATIPLAKDYHHLQADWPAGSKQIDWWKKYLDPRLQPK